MLAPDRRLGNRIPIQVFLTQYVADRPVRALSVNLSETGMFVQTANPGGDPIWHPEQTVGIELELPGTGEVIWAAGRPCYRRADAFAIGTGIRFTAMARAHARLIRDYCAAARRSHLVGLLDRIRAPDAARARA